MKVFILFPMVSINFCLLPLESYFQSESCSDAMITRLVLVPTLMIKFYSDGKHFKVLIKIYFL